MTQSRTRLSRRAALVGIGASGVMTLASAAAGAAQARDGDADFEKAVATLHAAMLSGDGAVLERLLHDHLNYMHSSGQSQTKAAVLKDLAGRRFFADLGYSDAVFSVVDRSGLVSMVVDQIKNLPDGKTRPSRIKVLQTWVDTDGQWKLLGRCSAIIFSPIAPKTCADDTPA